MTEALAIYGREHAVKVAAPERIGAAIEALCGFWGALNVGDVKGETCRRYGLSRVTSKGMPEGETRPVGEGTIRRELNVLQAAINYCHAEGYLTHPAKVTLPEAPPPKDRWLSRAEAAGLIRAARKLQRGSHVAWFILLALYTGTRKDAILRLGFMPNTTGGWIDVDQGVLHRRGAEERQTKKRRAPMRLPRKLLAHCRRRKASGAIWAVHENGQRLGDVKRSFAAACEAAGLSDVTPHTLKHTAITWAMQKGMKPDDAAAYFSTSRETIFRVYWHHSPDFQKDAAEVMDRKL